MHDGCSGRVCESSARLETEVASIALKYPRQTSRPSCRRQEVDRAGNGGRRITTLVGLPSARQVHYLFAN
ncbi:Hypothetical protein NTJ_09037 [Nesidiocoris tenuis]|uniref:Uncharacterized protein n=1 Tax=Nesidiocoris tenuis TaxID=355587 RepID=A0ABN7AW53_9HEMI|nr:Hypothetical protein NTJ_09037 [Nesidiocoris tenuis]